jgi:sugar phosphate permease
MNGEKRDADIMNLFCFTLRYAILEWGENFMQSHLGCTFLESESTFCKCYYIVKK